MFTNLKKWQKGLLLFLILNFLLYLLLNSVFPKSADSSEEVGMIIALIFYSLGLFLPLVLTLFSTQKWVKVTFLTILIIFSGIIVVVTLNIGSVAPAFDKALTELTPTQTSLMDSKCGGLDKFGESTNEAYEKCGHTTDEQCYSPLYRSIAADWKQCRRDTYKEIKGPLSLFGIDVRARIAAPFILPFYLSGGGH